MRLLLCFVLLTNIQSTNTVDYRPLYLFGGLCGAYVITTIVIHIKNTICYQLEQHRIFSEKLMLADLFHLKDQEERHKKIKEFFTKNSHRINESCVFIYSPKAPARKPLYCALAIKDYALALWFVEQKATLPSNWTHDQLKIAYQKSLDIKE